jgi:hypothetical protein
MLRNPYKTGLPWASTNPWAKLSAVTFQAVISLQVQKLQGGNAKATDAHPKTKATDTAVMPRIKKVTALHPLKVFITYLLYCKYLVQNPGLHPRKTWKKRFSDSGTGFF